jgi:hypothetical protein
MVDAQLMPHASARHAQARHPSPGLAAPAPTFFESLGSIDKSLRDAGILNLSPAVPSLPTSGE